MAPLILTEEEFNAYKAHFEQYDQSVAMEVVPQTDPVAFTSRIRAIIQDNRRIEARDSAKQGSDSMPMDVAWGPTVKSELSMAQFYKLVPQGTGKVEDSTDGRIFGSFGTIAQTLSLPGLPGIALQEHPRQEGEATRFQARDVTDNKPNAFQKLYRVQSLVEVTPDEISAEMGKRARKNAKPAIYIRGAIVEPKLKVEI